MPFAAIRRTHDDRSRWRSALLEGAVIGSAVAYVLATLSPLSLLGEVSPPGSGEFPQNLNLVPVIDMLSTRPQLLLINLALLLPFGFVGQPSACAGSHWCPWSSPSRSRRLSSSTQCVGATSTMSC